MKISEFTKKFYYEKKILLWKPNSTEEHSISLDYPLKTMLEKKSRTNIAHRDLQDKIRFS